jgi:hypothetical protein
MEALVTASETCLPCPSQSVGLAPYFSRIVTMPACSLRACAAPLPLRPLFWTARCRGVEPAPFRCVGLAPAWRSACTAASAVVVCDRASLSGTGADLDGLRVELGGDAAGQLEPDVDLICARPLVDMFDAAFSEDSSPRCLCPVAKLHAHAAERGTLVVALDQEQNRHPLAVGKHVDQRTASRVRFETAPVNMPSR